MTPITDLTKQNTFYDALFLDISFNQQHISNKTFESCHFKNSDFSETIFTNCKFIDCDFLSTNLTSAEFNNTSFSDVAFVESKLMGINWAKAKWPLIKLTSPINFYQSNISFSSFYELELQEIRIEGCKAEEVDFRGCNLSQGYFVQTDFARSLFMHTTLNAADFTEAVNYQIDPLNNSIKKAKFSLPDAMNLLSSFEIEIVD